MPVMSHLFASVLFASADASFANEPSFRFAVLAHPFASA